MPVYRCHHCEATARAEGFAGLPSAVCEKGDESDPYHGWESVDTETYRVIYREGEQDLVNGAITFGPEQTLLVDATCVTERMIRGVDKDGRDIAVHLDPRQAIHARKAGRLTGAFSIRVGYRRHVEKVGEPMHRVVSYTALGLDGAVRTAIDCRDSWEFDDALSVAVADIRERGEKIEAEAVDVLNVRAPRGQEVA